MRDKGAQNQLMKETGTQRFTLTGIYKAPLNQQQNKNKNKTSYKKQSAIQAFHSPPDLLWPLQGHVRVKQTQAGLLLCCESNKPAPAS